MPRAEKIRKIRKRLALSQLRLAQLTGYTPSAIAHYEAGRRTPSTRFLRRLKQVETSGEPLGALQGRAVEEWPKAPSTDARLSALERRLASMESLLMEAVELLRASGSRQPAARKQQPSASSGVILGEPPVIIRGEQEAKKIKRAKRG